ncbi:hypothetical protein LZZ85_15120 [Terrimonas sp. NA20]|uniref:DUF5117 domain-containing protein n=1 Tax=Terrimonas ginsenosidimutans TaxID=2908004 RepID=A0ABS9KTK4_9BACT|nr:hypothetical protein [Terrimonas ginsenosidimutans]MCG2615630.1 hypothetical protein [Terrimonas ginsenosidimutans]
MKSFFLCMFFCASLAWISGCKSEKKPSLSGDEPVEIADFIDFFPEITLPFQVADTSLLKKDNDSLRINYKIFTQFVPDSILSASMGKSAQAKIYPVGRIAKDETYLLAKVINGNNRAVFILGFDKKKQFIAGMPLLKQDANPATQQMTTLDSRSTITKTVVRKNAAGTSEGKDVYVLNNDAKAFMLIMTDPLDDVVSELINPIDTFARKLKYSADYSSGKLNLVSVRDGRKKDRFSFFVHFEKGECSGELKGEAIWQTPTKAVYSEAGDPCSLQFTFSNNAVTLKELEGCGSRRGLRCSFDGSYAKKKEPRPKKPAKRE